MPLPTVLRIVAGLICLMVIGEYFVLGELLLPPFVVASVLILLSFVYAKWRKATLWIAIVLSILIPIGALNGYLKGNLVIVVPIFDSIIFAWVLWTAIRELRRSKQAAAA